MPQLFIFLHELPIVLVVLEGRMPKILYFVLEVVDLGFLIFGLYHAVVLLDHFAAICLHFVYFRSHYGQQPLLVGLHSLPYYFIHLVNNAMDFLIVLNEPVEIFLCFLHMPLNIDAFCRVGFLFVIAVLHLSEFEGPGQGKGQVIRFDSPPECG